MSHQAHDAVGLEIGRRVALGLSQHPEWIELAKSNLDRWSRLNRDAPGLLGCYQEWRQLLDRPLEEISAAPTTQTEQGQRLRQNSPFAGVLSPHQVWEIKRQVHEATAA